MARLRKSGVKTDMFKGFTALPGTSGRSGGMRKGRGKGVPKGSFTMTIHAKEPKRDF